VNEQLNTLLFAWAASSSNKGDRSLIARMTGQINSSPGAQSMKDSRGHVVDADSSDRAAYHCCYSDECIKHMDTTVRALPEKMRKVIEARYKWREGLSVIDRARRLHIDRATYYRRLSRALELIDTAIDWRLVKQ
jgi:DNA-directed RNA polymerase specialized sigma subunit